MKTEAVPLHGKAQAKVPNRVVDQFALSTLPPLAIKLLLYAAYCFEQRVRSSSVPAEADLRFRFSLRSLKNVFTPEVAATARADYRHLRRAVDALKLHLEHERAVHQEKNGTCEGRRLARILSAIAVDDKTATVTCEVSTSFRQLATKPDERFTLVRLHDAIALSCSRQLALYILASRVKAFAAPAMREVPVGEVIRQLGFTGDCFSEWGRQVWPKLSDCMYVINEKTTFNLWLEPICEPDKREVVALRMTRLEVKVTRPQKKSRGPSIYDELDVLDCWRAARDDNGQRFPLSHFRSYLPPDHETNRSDS